MAIKVKKLPTCPKCESTNRRVFRYHGLGDLLKCYACGFVGAVRKVNGDRSQATSATLGNLSPGATLGRAYRVVPYQIVTIGAPMPVSYDDEVTAEQVAAIDESLRDEFERGVWEVLETE